MKSKSLLLQSSFCSPWCESSDSSSSILFDSNADELNETVCCSIMSGVTPIFLLFSTS